MTVKNFKINTGLDLNGLVLEQGTGNSLLWNNATLATQQYVIDAVAGVTVDPSGWAGTWLDWNSGSNQFDVNIPSGTYAAPSDIIYYTFPYGMGLDGANITFTSDIADALSYYGVAKSSDIPSMYSIAAALVTDGPSTSGYILNVGGSTLLDLDVSKLYTDLTTFQVDNLAKMSDIPSLSGYATESYVNSQGFITSSALSGYATETWVGENYEIKKLTTNSNGLKVINGELQIALGTGLTTETGMGTYLAVDTTTIATKAYVDATAQGLDVKASVVSASTENLDLSSIGSMTQVGGIDLFPDARYLLKDQTDPSQNGIYVFDMATIQLIRTADATFDANGEGTLTRGSFTFVERGTHAGKGFVVTEIAGIGSTPPYLAYGNTWSQFSETGNYITSVGSNLAVTGGQLTVDLSSKQDAFTLGTGLTNESATTIGVDLNAIAGTGITVNNGQLEAAPAYITSVDASFAVTNGELSLSDTITIASVELTDSVANVTASSDVFGNGSTSTYSRGSDQTVGTVTTGTEVADVLITLKDSSGNSRTSKITVVFTGTDAPTWTEYGIIASGWTSATTIGFDSSKNIIVNVTGSGTYSAKGVFTTIK